MSYWTLPEGRLAGGLICVLRPDDVMGGEAACTREGGYGTASTSEQPSRMEEINLAWSASRLFNGAPPRGIVGHPSTRLTKEKCRNALGLSRMRRAGPTSPYNEAWKGDDSLVGGAL